MMSNNKSAAFDHKPKVSVIIPLYNHEKYIKEAIHSVLEQSFSDFELIIINDGSTDNSEDIVRSVNDDRIKYFYQENQGAHNTINRGINLARGEYISILNSDDGYYPDRFEKCLHILESDKSIFAAFSHLEFINDEGKFIRFMRGVEDYLLNPEAKTFKGENNILLDLFTGNFLITTSNLFCRKSVFESIGYFSSLRYTHDYDLFLRLCYHYKVHIIEEILLKYRIHGSNIIKENEAVVNFEVGLVLANFFLNYDLESIFKHKNDLYISMTKIFNYLNTCKTDRMVLTLLLFGMTYQEDKREFFKALTANPENFFRKICIDHFRTAIDVWQESQVAWQKLSETEQKLSETEQKLSEAEQKLTEKIQQLQALLNSYSFRVGRTLTWPVRKLLGKK